ncbi:MAG: alpha-glucoside ABC transporter permease, partial [Pseudomonadota bacterium]
MDQLLFAVLTILFGVTGCVAYYFFSNLALDAALPPRGPQAGANIVRANMIRPWLFLGPAVLILGVYLVYPVINSIWLSLHDGDGDAFIGGENYQWLVSDAKFRESFRNNMLWLIVVPALSTFFGLIAAALTDRISWGNLAKSLIFMPMAISFIGA